MSRRDLIRMSPDEQLAFLGEQRVVTVASVGPNGRPHLMPLWFIVEPAPADVGGADTTGPPRLLAWTYGSSQKVKNLERLPQATLLAEAGEEYQELRGIQAEADVELITDTDAVARLGLEIALRYAPGDVSADDAPPELKAMIAQQATKRVGLRFTPTKLVTWDHRKLGGVY
ncbi:MAG: pyridoxamine 5'-phosphate oxidase family protein [Solirubrobacteraceae bacterium]|nr:pyridoxamine 5'-phosphate oxidase family protein [Patulibacter sp.]